jgi:glycine cleavage system pyridoxal-binding protein P
VVINLGTFIPNTKEEQQEMLHEIGCRDWDDLFRDIPPEARIKDGLNLPDGKSEMEVTRIMERTAAKNTVFPTIFRGAGAYNHYVPAAVNAVAGKEEFLTAYTPYQAEISQGILQSIFEYQTMRSPTPILTEPLTRKKSQEPSASLEGWMNWTVKSRMQQTRPSRQSMVRKSFLL